MESLVIFFNKSVALRLSYRLTGPGRRRPVTGGVQETKLLAQGTQTPNLVACVFLTGKVLQLET